MPQLQDLTLTDRQATPVTHTFTPSGITAGVATVVSGTGLLVAEKKFTISSRRTKDRVKTRMVLSYPIVQNETINGVVKPKVVREGFADVTFSFSVESTEAERNDVVGMLSSALATGKVLVNDTVVKAQAVY